MVRFVSREDAIRWAVPPDAEIISNEPDRVTYRHNGEVVALEVFQVPNGCEECPDNWTVRRDA